MIGFSYIYLYHKIGCYLSLCDVLVNTGFSVSNEEVIDKLKLIGHYDHAVNETRRDFLCHIIERKFTEYKLWKLWHCNDGKLGILPGPGTSWQFYYGSETCKKNLLINECYGLLAALIFTRIYRFGTTVLYMSKKWYLVGRAASSTSHTVLGAIFFLGLGISGLRFSWN